MSHQYGPLNATHWAFHRQRGGCRAAISMRLTLFRPNPNEYSNLSEKRSTLLDVGLESIPRLIEGIYEKIQSNLKKRTTGNRGHT